MLKLKAGDEIIIATGKDKGKKGKIEKVLASENKILVPGINVYKRHRKVSKNQRAGIFHVERPVAIAKVMVICPNCGKPTRVGFKMEGKDTKVRICKKCKGVIK